MDYKESSQLSAEDEYKHWWIKTRFQYINAVLKYANKSEILRVLEIGCGTGQNLRFIRQNSICASRCTQVVGLDPHMPRDFMNPEWMNSQDQFVKGLPSDEPANLRGKKFDIILAMDVLEHVKDEEEALTQWRHLLKPNGFLLITVPAFQALWSYHDELLGHYRRYTRKHLENVLMKCDFSPLSTGYVFSWLLPVLWLFRGVMNINKKDRTDLKKTNPLLNEFLFLLGCLEARCGGFPFFGTSVVGIFRKTVCEEHSPHRS